MHTLTGVGRRANPAFERRRIFLTRASDPRCDEEVSDSRHVRLRTCVCHGDPLPNVQSPGVTKQLRSSMQPPTRLATPSSRIR